MDKDTDYYIDKDGNVVFTKEYHLKRGYCCKNGCKHCPWNFSKSEVNELNNNDYEA